MSYSPPKAWFYLRKRQALRRAASDLPAPPAGQSYVVDASGNYIVDSSGNYIIAAS